MCCRTFWTALCMTEAKVGGEIIISASSVMDLYVLIFDSDRLRPRLDI